jgi:hypothetical protein
VSRSSEERQRHQESKLRRLPHRDPLHKHANEASIFI